MGERWAIELCHQDYLSHGYFAGESQDSDRWLYYRTRTAGQNTILYNNTNQKVTAAPSVSFASSGTTESDPASLLDDSSTALWITNLTSAYHGPRIRRGLRLLGGRSQVLLQDEIQGAAHASQWRMHTRADIVTREGGKRARVYPPNFTAGLFTNQQGGSFDNERKENGCHPSKSRHRSVPYYGCRTFPERPPTPAR
jgi:hypothetical protein